MVLIQTGLTSHYHAIVFGISLADLERLDKKPLKIVKKKKLKYSDGTVKMSVVYTSSWLQDRWSIYHKDTKTYDPIGFVSIGEVTWETCAYVARYVQKKVFGGKTYLQDFYECEPEFSVMSRRPGIGFFFPIDHPDVFDYNKIRLKDCPKDINIPSRFLDLLISDDLSSTENTDRYNELKRLRKEYCSDRLLTKLLQSDLPYIERIEQEENEKLQKSALLKRDLEE